MQRDIDSIKSIIDNISMGIFSSKFTIRVDTDQVDGSRIFIQVLYEAPCSKTGSIETWRGRKWYLSDHMLDQEVVGTVYLAYKTAVDHEVMESFKIMESFCLILM